jgi:DNA-3-methyladenine glycosylase I
VDKSHSRKPRNKSPEPAPVCRWALASPELRAYHDREYGFPVRRDRDYFERLVLELFQAGLSWRTILAKRRAFRAAFDNFVPERVAAFSAAKVRRLLADPGIVRNRRKLEAAVANARAFVRLRRRYGSFGRFLRTLPLADQQATVSEFRRLFKFTGPQIVGEFLMSTGLWPVRHERACWRHAPRRPLNLRTCRSK